MAPAYVKYVEKSHNAVVTAAAESALQYVKAEMSDGSFTGVGKMYIYGSEIDEDGQIFTDGKRHIVIKWVDEDGTKFNRNVDSMQYSPEGAVGNGYDAFISGCGVDYNKQIRSELIYKIEIFDNSTISGHPDPQASMDTVDDVDNP